MRVDATRPSNGENEGGRRLLRRGRSRVDHAAKPCLYGGGHSLEVRLESVIARHHGYPASHARRRHPETLALALTHQRGHRDRVELGQAALRRLTRARRRLEGEGEAEHRHGAGRSRRATGDAGAHRPTANDYAQPRQLIDAQALDDRDPGGVKLRRAWRRAPAGDAIGLLDQRHADPLYPGDLRRGPEIWRFHPSRRTMAEHQRRARLIDQIQMGTRRAVRSIDLDDSHQGTAPCSSTNVPVGPDWSSCAMRTMISAP